MRRRYLLSKSDSDQFPCLYKGYWINKNPLGIATYWIEKDKQHIGYCTGLEDGKRIIDVILGG